MQKMILIPAMTLAAGLFLSELAQAQPYYRTGPAVGVFVRPGPGPYVGIRAPGVGISIGAPLATYPILRSPAVIVDTAPPPVVVYDDYIVEYRTRIGDPWRVYRGYASRRAAFDVADQLRDMGYHTRVLRD